MLKNIISLIKKDFLLEVRHKSGFSGVMIYALASIYICYLAFRQNVDSTVWNSLLWIIILFAATNAVARSFLGESKERHLFYYTLLDPRAVIISKTIFNFLMLLLITFINVFAFMVLLGNPVADFPMFTLGLTLGVCAVSSVLTLVSALASKAENSSALMAILGFPLLIPLLITAIRFSKNAIEGMERSVNQPYLIILIALNLLVFALSFLLFPYLWRD